MHYSFNYSLSICLFQQTEILKFVFVIYFRVLKCEKKTELLSPVLRGLSKFAHLINIDFFSDINIALKRLINSGVRHFTLIIMFLVFFVERKADCFLFIANQ